MSQNNDDATIEKPVQTGQSSQAPAEGVEDQPEQSDKTQGQSSEAPATG